LYKYEKLKDNLTFRLYKKQGKQVRNKENDHFLI